MKNSSAEILSTADADSASRRLYSKFKFYQLLSITKRQADFLHSFTRGTKVRLVSGQDIISTFCANGRVKSANQLKVKVNKDHKTIKKLNRMAVMSTINRTNNNKSFQQYSSQRSCRNITHNLCMAQIVLIFMCPCITSIILNYNQQDATFFDLFIYFYRRSISFRRFLRPSSGAHNCKHSFRYCQPILLLAAIVVDEMEHSSISSTIAASSTIG